MSPAATAWIVLHRATDRWTGWVASSAVACLVAADIAQGTEWQSIINAFSSSTTGAATSRTDNEVKDYVEFITIATGASSSVVTGIRYQSSLNRLVTEQWCYVAVDAAPSRRDTLYLATAKGTESPVATAISQEDLLKFGLTAEAAIELRDTLCRFRLESHHDA